MVSWVQGRVTIACCGRLEIWCDKNGGVICIPPTGTKSMVLGIGLGIVGTLDENWHKIIPRRNALH